MSDWIREPFPVRRNDAMARILGSIPPGSLSLPEGDLLPGDWWRLESNGEVVGYGWMDVTWGDAQVMIAVSADHRKAGHGATIVDHLAKEAHQRGLAYLFNTIPADHPDPDGVRAFLERQGFVSSGLEKRLLRRRVRG